jgi:hypothetical protein
MEDAENERMLERITYWQDEIFRAPEVVVPTAIFLFVVLIGLVRGLRRTRVVEHNGVEVEARRWVGDRLNEHVDVLAEAYSEASPHAEHDELPSDFAAARARLGRLRCRPRRRGPGVRRAPSRGALRGRNQPSPRVSGCSLNLPARFL